jgi:hypothetical protein
MRRPGFPEGVWFESRGHGWLFEYSVLVVFRFSFWWRGVADGFQHPTVVELVEPLERREFDTFDGSLLCTSINALRHDVLPLFWTVLSWNFPLMIPGLGRGGFHESVEVHGGSDCLRSEAG